MLIVCRLHELYTREPPHITTDPELYSLKDLIDVKSGDLITRLQDLVTASKNHVTNCEVCNDAHFSYSNAHKIFMV
jgi:hypothetical protein